jgi:hypothetical protein
MAQKRLSEVAKKRIRAGAFPSMMEMFNTRPESGK